MKSTIAISALLGLTAAIPTPPGERILPSNWKFEILSLKGPGCADKGERTTRPTFGMNTVDGSEIYYWHIAYPSLSAEIGPGVAAEKSHTWCETTLKYTELENWESAKELRDYRLRLHKNGTRVMSRYDLEEGVKAKWKFTYFTDDGELTDEITVKGPLKPGVSNENHNSESTGPVSPVPECGTAVIKYRTDVWLEAEDEEAKGKVIADRVSVEGQKYTEIPYGVEQGFSYDWERCKE